MYIISIQFLHGFLQAFDFSRETLSLILQEVVLAASIFKFGVEFRSFFLGVFDGFSQRLLRLLQFGSDLFKFMIKFLFFFIQ